MKATSPLYRWMLALSLVWLVTQASSGAEPLRVEVLELQNRPAEEIIPIIAKVTDPSVRLSGFGMKLIIKATPTQISETRSLIQEFDVELRNLVLRFLLRGRDDNVGGQGSGSATVVLGKRSVLDPRRPADKGEIRVVASGEGLAEERDTFETIRVQEGTPAYIRIGETRVLRSDRQWSDSIRPVVRVGRGGGSGSGRVSVNVRTWPHTGSNEPLLLRKTGVELAVIATPLGNERVRIEIARMTGNDKTADPLAVPTARARTVITAELGQWVNVATLTRSSVSRAAQGTLDSSETGRESRALRIRADLAD